MIGENIKKVIKPYQTVQIDFIANKLCLDREIVLKKIQIMVLDEEIRGSIDQESDSLVLSKIQLRESSFGPMIDIFGNLDSALDLLEERAFKIKAQ